MEDLKKLTQSGADHKLMFLTDAAAFAILCKPYYARYARGIEIVDLLTGQDVLPSVKHGHRRI